MIIPINVQKAFGKIHSWYKLKAFPLRCGTRQRCALSLLFFNVVLEVLVNAIRQEKRIKGIQSGKKKKRNSSFTHGMIIYVENPNELIKELLELIKGYSKVSGFKVNVHKSITFLYANNEQVEIEIKNIMPREYFNLVNC